MDTRIVYTTMAADMFHRGHLEFLKTCKKLGGTLVVGLHPDWVIEDYKGKKPVIPYVDRKAVLESCRYVDMVIEAVDWNVPKDAEIVVHADQWVPEYNRRKDQTLLIIPRYKGESTSKIKERLHDTCKCRGRCNRKTS